MAPPPRDIVARGRAQARIAVALLLAPQVFLLLQALDAGGVSSGGETARAVVWIGLVYLVYRGFRLTRWLVLLVGTVGAVISGFMVIKSAGPEGLASLILSLMVGTVAPAVGVAMLFLAPAVRVFLTYQLGGKVPDT